jgi:hypothetical protein
MTLDTAGERANEPGWTRAALKAEQARLKAEKKAARKAKAKAGRQALVLGVRHFFGDIWDFVLRNLLLTLAMAACIGTGAWEWVNTGRGWRDLYPGVGVWAYIGAAGAIALWYIAARLVCEHARKPKHSWFQIIGWSVTAMAAYFVCVTGVFVATSTNSVKAQNAARESRIEYAQLRARAEDLRQQVELYPVEYWQASIDQDERAINAQVNIAKGSFGMADLDAGESGACAGKLSFNQRRLCAIVNGGVDEFTGERIIGLRAELERSKRGLKKAEADAVALVALEAEVAGFRVLTGDETAEAMGHMFKWLEGEAALGWLLLILSSAFLLASGWAADWVLETIEIKRIAARKAAGRA